MLDRSAIFLRSAARYFSFSISDRLGNCSLPVKAGAQLVSQSPAGHSGGTAIVQTASFMIWQSIDRQNQSRQVAIQTGINAKRAGARNCSDRPFVVGHFFKLTQYRPLTQRTKREYSSSSVLVMGGDHAENVCARVGRAGIADAVCRYDCGVGSGHPAALRFGHSFPHRRTGAAWLEDPPRERGIERSMGLRGN